MKFTFNWLKEFVTFKASPEKLAELFTMAGLEVESLTPLREPETNREDWLFEISVTPNRGDCLGITGLAKEVSALSGGLVKSAAFAGHFKDSRVAGRADAQRGTKGVSIAIESPRLCPRYSAQIVEEIRVGPSPAWMRFRLESCGIRPVSNVVDITNYVMLETGQPLHAFDLDRLPSRRIVVRPAKEIKKFTTLDSVERELAAEDVLICDGDVPVALAGVMGGLDSEVGPQTRAVLLESANFDPKSVRRTAKRLGLQSEASHRFERGVNPEGTVAALDRAVYLLAELAGAKPLRGVVDRYPRRPKTPAILLRMERIEKLLGVHMDARQVEKMLSSLGLKTRKLSRNGKIKVVPPPSRPDLIREADLIEEVARLHGYKNIPTTLPLIRPAGGKTDHRLRRERLIRTFLAGEGFVEVINLPFTSERLNRLFSGLWEGSAAPVTVLNPLVKESAEMRLSLIPGLIENLRINLAQKASGFFSFHLGKVFRLAPNGDTEERQCLAGVLYGSRQRVGLRSSQETSALTFIDCKGLADGIFDVLGISHRAAWTRDVGSMLHPGWSASVVLDGKKLGYVGMIHPDVCDELDLPRFFVFELDFERLLEYAPRRIRTGFLPRFPAVERDLAIVVDEHFLSQLIVEWIKALNHSLIEKVEVFDEYRGSSIPEGKKSLAYQISYRAEDRTLTDAEVNALHQSVVEGIGKVFGAEQRS